MGALKAPIFNCKGGSKLATKKTEIKKKYKFTCVSSPYLWVSYLNVQFMESKYETDSEEIAQELRRYPQIEEVE